LSPHVLQQPFGLAHVVLQLGSMRSTCLGAILVLLAVCSSEAQPHALAAEFKGSLVAPTNGSLSPFDDEPLAKKKLIALYFSAGWCGPCRRFTPELVQFLQPRDCQESGRRNRFRER
jgi:thiol-disulfide isomerase/thioredoxin